MKYDRIDGLSFALSKEQKFAEGGVMQKGAKLAVTAMVLLSAGQAWAGTVNYEYDDAGRLKKAQYPNAAVRHYVLDASGNRQQVTPNTNATPSSSSNDPKAVPLQAILMLLLE